MPRVCATGPHQGWQPDPHSPAVKKYINDGLDDAEKRLLEPAFPNKDEALQAVGKTSEESQEWGKLQPTHTRKKNSSALMGLARQRNEGIINRDDWVKAVREKNPPKAFEEVQDVPEYEEMVMALNLPQKGIIYTGGKRYAGMKKLPTGMRVASSLDIPAYRMNDLWVVTVHVPTPTLTAGKVIGYAKSAHLTNVTFQEGSRNAKQAMNIAQGGQKTPIATFIGSWVDTTTDKVIKDSEKALKDKSDWVQIGMNPDRGEFFYDKDGFKPVASAEEVLQVGSLLMARGVTYL